MSAYSREALIKKKSYCKVGAYLRWALDDDLVVLRSTTFLIFSHGESNNNQLPGLNNSSPPTLLQVLSTTGDAMIPRAVQSQPFSYYLQLHGIAIAFRRLSSTQLRFGYASHLHRPCHSSQAS